jgi:NAD(P)-dependent dehydrogenase (short-subunit alcohol dehydrogenase family)
MAEQPAPNKSTLDAATRLRTRTYKDAVAIITGGASGIGRALAEELSKKGARAVVLVDRQADLAEEVADGLRKSVSGTETIVYAVDVRDFTEMQRVVNETVESYGHLDLIFNNAGVTVCAPLDEIGVDDFNYVLDVNIRGVTNGVQAAYPVMKRQGFGHIVNTASMAGLLPCGEGIAAYSTSKYAVVGISVNLRIEAARHGVRVSAFCPGFIDTAILKGGGKYGKTYIPDEEAEIFLAKFHPMDPKLFATRALKLVARNKAIIILPRWPWCMIWFLSRLSPSLGMYLARKQNDKMVEMLKKNLSEKTRE